ncbi:MAG TPA: type II toxin-antitoxin system RelB/DinJ family antitoxin [Clostridiales bacterium]|nr:type II toxin-antitoxin system RelB/DinJ family antitoxin [Clostridiales bacterium]
MAKTLIQIRTDEEIKTKATELFEQLGLNVSDAVNLFLRQVIFAKGLPFEVKLPEKIIVNGKASEYSKDELISEVKASMAMEGMPLTKENIGWLEALETGNMTSDELRTVLAKRYGSKSEGHIS